MEIILKGKLRKHLKRQNKYNIIELIIKLLYYEIGITNNY